MNESMQRGLWLTFGILIVLFLLLDGGALAGVLFSGDGTTSSGNWVWVAPTLLIFGMGFVLGWLVFGNGILNPRERRRVQRSDSVPDVRRETDAAAFDRGEFNSSRS